MTDIEFTNQRWVKVLWGIVVICGFLMIFCIIGIVVMRLIQVIMFFI